MTVMKKWIDASFPKDAWGSPNYNLCVSFYNQLSNCTGVDDCQTNPFFVALGPIDLYVIYPYNKDLTTFAACTARSPQSIGWDMGGALNRAMANWGWNVNPNVYGS